MLIKIHHHCPGWLVVVSILLCVASIWVSSIGFYDIFALAIPTKSSSRIFFHSEQLATDYKVLVIRAGSPSAVYYLDLQEQKFGRIAQGKGYELSVSPDGYMIAFDVDEKLYIAHGDGTDLQLVAEAEGFFTTSWSPNGQWLVYTASDRMAGNENLYVLNLVTLEAKRLSLGTFSTIWPTGWSPDSGQVFFLGRKPSTEELPFDKPYCNLYQIDINGSNLINLSRDVGYVVYSSVSPDGQTIMFNTYTKNWTETTREGDEMYDIDVFLLNLQTRELTTVRHMLVGRQEGPIGNVGNPWSPNGDWVLQPPRSTFPETLRAIKLNGTLHHEIIDLVYGSQSGTGIDPMTTIISPDGQTLVGAGRYEEQSKKCLCAIDTDGSRFRALVLDVYPTWLVWSPDSKSIFFQYTEEEYGTDYRYGIVNVDGSGFYDPFAYLSEKPEFIQDVHWVRLIAPPPVPTTTATVTVSTPTLVPTFSPNPAVCTTAGVVILALVSALWLARRNK